MPLTYDVTLVFTAVILMANGLLQTTSFVYRRRRRLSPHWHARLRTARPSPSRSILRRVSAHDRRRLPVQQDTDDGTRFSARACSTLCQCWRGRSRLHIAAGEMAKKRLGVALVVPPIC